MILSRPARLLECLEFNPAEFYTQLEFEERSLIEHKTTVGDDIEIGDYIRTKLGLIQVEDETGTENKNGDENSDEKAAVRKVCFTSSYPTHKKVWQKYSVKIQFIC